MKISIIGTGNVAYHLGKRLLEKGGKINQIIGRNAAHTEGVARILKTESETDFNKIKTDSDIYIIAVSDSAIESVAEQLSHALDNSIVVHTSGSIPSTILKPYFTHYGSFYPLQTFSKESQPDFDSIPIFINANTEKSENELMALGKKIAINLHHLDDDKRIIVHIAAVFVNNFTNSLFQMGHDILKKEGLPFDILQPLMLETVLKIKNHEPAEMQTGPAKRGDLITIKKHLDYLKKDAPQLVSIYELLTKNINPNIEI
jgi:predicted short-subunit dehydrogenase-like oxidoreductase (DUF2520 family)